MSLGNTAAAVERFGSDACVFGGCSPQSSSTILSTDIVSRMDQQQGEKRPLLLAAQRQAPLLLLDLEWA
jgi:hypothetical protein